MKTGRRQIGGDPLPVVFAKAISKLRNGNWLNKLESIDSTRVAGTQQPQAERKAIVLPSSLSEAFEIVLGRAVDCRNKGEDIYIVQCNGHIGGCPANPLGLGSVCTQCRQIRDLALDNHLDRVSRVSLENYLNTAPSTSVDSASHRRVIEEIKSGAESTILTFFRVAIHNARIDRRIHAFILKRYIRYSTHVFNCLRRVLEEIPTARVEVFNGRIVPAKAVIAAARSARTSISLIEVWGRDKALIVSDNESFHDLDYQKRLLRDFLSETNDSDRVGHEFFHLRRKGLPTNDRSFTEGQCEGYLPNSAGRKLISIFLSSPDELKVSGPQWFTSLSTNPARFIIDLAAVLNESYLIIVRMHPNQKGDRTGESDEIIRQLGKVERIRLITPTDPASTYELIDKSAFVITFGSSVGLEATYWGRPSILAGHAIWEDCCVSYNCNTLEEVVRIIERDRPPFDSTNAVRVGSFLMRNHTLSSSLTYKDGKFFVDGRNYLGDKRRRGFLAKANRIFDACLRARLDEVLRNRLRYTKEPAE